MSPLKPNPQCAVARLKNAYLAPAARWGGMTRSAIRPAQDGGASVRAVRRVVSAIVVATALAGCGSGSDGSESRTTAVDAGPTTTSTATPTPTPTATATPETATDRVRRKIEKAGYEVEDDAPGGKPAPEGALIVRLKGRAQVRVYIHSSRSAARRVGTQLNAVERESPEQFEATVRGVVVYAGTQEAPAELDEHEFSRVVDAGGSGA